MVGDLICQIGVIIVECTRMDTIDTEVVVHKNVIMNI